jgi:hypothetical protein
MRRGVISLVILLAACSARGARTSESAAEFLQSIDRLAGTGAIDCGIHEYPGEKMGADTRREAVTCAQRALGSGKPFRYGTRRMPIDSLSTEVLVRAPDSTLWLINRDREPAAELPQQWNFICTSTNVDPQTMYIDRNGCAVKSEGALTFP